MLQKDIINLIKIKTVDVFIVFVAVFISFLNANAQSSRSFRMGFTPWPYDATLEAVNYTYGRLAELGDVVSHNMEEGVPWEESLHDTPFPSSYQVEIQSRLNRKVAGKSTILSLNALNGDRSSLAPNRGATPNEPLPSFWSSKQLDSVEVIEAYGRYTERMVELFSPDYLLLGVEVNLLLRNSPSKWPAYLKLLSATSKRIKTRFPNLPLGVSVFSVPYFDEYSSEDDSDVQKEALKQFENYIDIVAFSVHPFMSALLCNSFPSDYFSKLFSLTQKPKIISESSYPAQVWSTNLSGSSVVFNCSESKQRNFLRQMLEASQHSNVRAVIWFAVRDYDAFWNGALNQSPLSLIWRDTGLYSENGASREALELWQHTYTEPYSLDIPSTPSKLRRKK